MSTADPIAHSSMAETSGTSMPSFDDLSLPSLNVPSVPVEGSIADSLAVNATSHEPPELEYHLIPGASKFGKDILTDSRHFSYTMKQMKGTVLDVPNWRCTKQNSPKVNCTATVWQEGNIFILGKSHHTCTAEPEITNNLLIKKEIKSTALKNIFTPAMEITNKVLQENITNEPVPSLPAQGNLWRAANRYRQYFWPKDAVNLDFEIAEDHLPEGFFCKDITVGDQCHLQFATDNMTQLLSCAKNWYINATFKVVRHPFTQLLHIYAFITSGDRTKQVPLLVVIMSGKSKQDYKRVLKAVIKLLPSKRVETITIDFETAMWKAIHRVLPTVQIFGCFFHWAQAVWRKVQALGLQSTYTSNNATHKYIKKLMSLPYLPAAHK